MDELIKKRYDIDATGKYPNLRNIIKLLMDIEDILLAERSQTQTINIAWIQ